MLKLYLGNVNEATFCLSPAGGESRCRGEEGPPRASPVSLYRQPSAFGVSVEVRVFIIVCDDEGMFLAMKDNFSSSRGIFGSLCDGMVDPPQ